MIIRNTLIFILSWFAAMIVYSILNGVKDFTLLWQIFLLPALFLGAIAFIVSFYEKMSGGIKKLSVVFILIAIAIDQGVKIWLFSREWQNISEAIIPPVFYFEPSHNTLGSYLWVLLKLRDVSHLLNVVLVVIIGTIFIEFWRFYRQKRRNSSWINVFMNLFLAGISCNLIDNIFHGGSLDYITIRPFYIFDMKDMYITMGLMFIIIEIIDNKLYKDDKEFNREMWEFVKGDVRTLFGRGGKKE